MSNADHYPSLLQHGVVPDVLTLPDKVSYSLTIKWPNTTLDVPGKELDREDTQPEPTITLNPAPSEQHNDFVLIMTDPDLMMNNDTAFGQVRHWLATNLSTNSSGELLIPSSSNVSPYVGPAPLPNYMYSRPHRYVFILARPSSPSTSKVEVTPEELRDLQKPYKAAVSGKQKADVQDLKDRWGFNAREFLELKGLRAEAVTFMRVGGTARSAVANVGLMAQAMVDKVTGN